MARYACFELGMSIKLFNGYCRLVCEVFLPLQAQAESAQQEWLLIQSRFKTLQNQLGTTAPEYAALSADINTEQAAKVRIRTKAELEFRQKNRRKN
jgi:hypothetical protein